MNPLIHHLHRGSDCGCSS